MELQIVNEVLRHEKFVFKPKLEKVWIGEAQLYLPVDEDVVQSLMELIYNKPDIFLERYGNLLQLQSLLYFQNSQEMQVQKILFNQKKSTRQNRRWKKVQQFIDRDEYFTKEDIQQKDPLLYHQLIDQFEQPFCQEFEQLSDLLILLSRESCQRSQITQDQLEDNEDFLIRTMHERLIFGQDQLMNVSDNESLDDEEIINRDQEEQYFDDIEIGLSTDTGIQDF